MSHVATAELCWNLDVCVQCYVQQLRQLRQDAKQAEPITPAPSLTHPRHSGEVDWLVLSPRSQAHQLSANLALHLTTARSGSSPPALATSQVSAVNLGNAARPCHMLSCHLYLRFTFLAGNFILTVS